MNGQGQLGPLTTPSFPDPIFHFHLQKQTHITTHNIPKIPCILLKKKNTHQKLQTLPIIKNMTDISTMYIITYKPNTQ